MLYDEQPITFRQSWRQRMRWAKGFYQVLGKYGLKLAKNTVTKLSFACFDLLMTIFPAIFITLLSIICNVSRFIDSIFIARDGTRCSWRFFRLWAISAWCTASCS